MPKSQKPIISTVNSKAIKTAWRTFLLYSILLLNFFRFDPQLCSLEAGSESEPLPWVVRHAPCCSTAVQNPGGRPTEQLRATPGVQAAFMNVEHPLSRWVCWKAVGEVGKGQMEHRGKFTSDTSRVRKQQGDGGGRRWRWLAGRGGGKQRRREERWDSGTWGRDWRSSRHRRGWEWGWWGVWGVIMMEGGRTEMWPSTLVLLLDGSEWVTEQLCETKNRQRKNKYKVEEKHLSIFNYLFFSLDSFFKKPFQTMLN